MRAWSSMGWALPDSTRTSEEEKVPMPPATLRPVSPCFWLPGRLSSPPLDSPRNPAQNALLERSGV
eukprot:9478612-Pyramimonas_sp.AAC.1